MRRWINLMGLRWIEFWGDIAMARLFFDFLRATRRTEPELNLFDRNERAVGLMLRANYDARIMQGLKRPVDWKRAHIL